MRGLSALAQRFESSESVGLFTREEDRLIPYFQKPLTPLYQKQILFRFISLFRCRCNSDYYPYGGSWTATRSDFNTKR